MAKAAVLADRCMLPKIGAAGFSVTLLAGIVDIHTRKLRGDGVAVHVMAAHAVHLALQNRVRKCLARLVTLYLMAVETHVRLCRFLQDRIRCRVAGVTVRTGHLITGVSTGVPAKPDIALVTIQALFVLFFDRCASVSTEVNANRWPFLPSAHASGVSVARTMTGLALKLAVAEGPTRV